MFNSLRYTKDLEEAGVPRKQAEAHVGIMSDMMASHFVTSQDLKDLRFEMNSKFKDAHNEVESLRIEMQSEFRNVRQEMQNLEHRLTIKVGTMMATMLGLAVTIVTLLIKFA